MESSVPKKICGIRGQRLSPKCVLKGCPFGLAFCRHRGSIRATTSHRIVLLLEWRDGVCKRVIYSAHSIVNHKYVGIIVRNSGSLTCDYNLSGIWGHMTWRYREAVFAGSLCFASSLYSCGSSTVCCFFGVAAFRFANVNVIVLPVWANSPSTWLVLICVPFCVTFLCLSLCVSLRARLRLVFV